MVHSLAQRQGGSNLGQAMQLWQIFSKFMAAKAAASPPTDPATAPAPFTEPASPEGTEGSTIAPAMPTDAAPATNPLGSFCGG